MKLISTVVGLESRSKQVHSSSYSYIQCEEHEAGLGKSESQVDGALLYGGSGKSSCIRCFRGESISK